MGQTYRASVRSIEKFSRSRKGRPSGFYVPKLFSVSPKPFFLSYLFGFSVLLFASHSKTQLNMGVTKDQLLSRLQELQIDYSKFEHPVVLTVEAQAEHVGDLGGGLSKNLFLKDKKSRFYIVSVLADTKVDLKVLSARLGLGKGGLRMAPEEALGEILQVPLGCVTPFALVNESARHVSLLLDQGFKSQERCFFHPLSNDVTIFPDPTYLLLLLALKASDLDKFLKSIGRDPAYVDLEANPSVGKDQPPDLASFVPSGSIAIPDPTENSTPSKGPSEKSVASTDIKSTKITANASKPSSRAQNAKDKPVKDVNPSGLTANVERFVEEILDKTSALLLSQITEETIKQHGAQLGTVLSNSIKSCLSSELNSTTMTFKNTAYTEGFHAGIHHHPKPKY
ncbi:hypothetical protein L484_020173 [Morus notabilis]|uniref:YbaK/aminoacyl-tRNA synthetase-associated domain-containing protein n=1 Tax=Morus notabilis TaxID=981085 RepID=W9QVS0_9ROSA|nr:hypothetical protein L484_020173 [Morus notabilis]